MKKEAKNAKQKEPLTMTALLRRNPLPFGDVRKYYYAACIGTVVLLTLCFHISVVAIALRTDPCEQLSNVFIVFLLLFCIIAIVGHQMRSLLGYGISALSSLIVLLLLQFYHGTGVMIISNLPEYGEVFRDGAKSTDFWILLAKAVAVIHLLLTVVFINSTIKVKEEPALKGMNVQIQKIKDWIDKHNNSLPPGRRPSDYWFVVVSILLWMLFVAYDTTMGKFDYWSMGLLFAGCILVFCKQTLPGATLVVCSALVRCTMYQWRFGFCTPVIVSYVGAWFALMYLALEAIIARKKCVKRKESAWTKAASDVFVWFAVVIFVLIMSPHEFLGAFSGSYMVYQKDNLPLWFFLPIVIILVLLGRQRGCFVLVSGLAYWIRDSIRNASPYSRDGLFRFESIEEHGSVGEKTTKLLNGITNTVSMASTVLCVLSILTAVVLLTIFVIRRKHHGPEEASVVD